MNVEIPAPKFQKGQLVEVVYNGHLIGHGKIGWMGYNLAANLDDKGEIIVTSSGWGYNLLSENNLIGHDEDTLRLVEGRDV